MSLYSSLQQKDILVWTGYSSDRNPDATNLPQKKKKKSPPHKKKVDFSKSLRHSWIMEVIVSIHCKKVCGYV